MIEQYLKEDPKENANRLVGSFGFLKNSIAEEELKKFALTTMYRGEIADAHKKGFIHIHDLSNPIIGYCCGWSLMKILVDGFSGPSQVISARPPKHLSSALGQLVNFFGVVQQEWAGAQAVNSLDTLLSPFVYYDKLSYKEVKQAIQEFIYNLNVTYRWGMETVFSNVMFDLTCPKDLENTPVVIGGEVKDRCYGDFDEERELINRAFIEVMLEGDGNSKPFTFPIPTYGISKDFEWNGLGTLIARLAAKWGLPYFQNFVNSDLSQSDVRSMCCRLQISVKELRRKTGGLFGYGDSTGSLGVCLAPWEKVWVRDPETLQITTKKVEELQIGDTLISYWNGRIVDTKVVKKWIRKVARHVTIRVKTPEGKIKKLTGSPDHKLLTVDGKWKTLEEIQVGDVLMYVSLAKNNLLERKLEKRREWKIDSAALASRYNATKVWKNSKANVRLAKLTEKHNLPIRPNLEIAFPGAVPDFVVEGQRKVIEAERSEYRLRVAKKLKDDIYKKHGYKCLWLLVSADKTDDELLDEIQRFIYNGAVVIEKTESKEVTKIRNQCGEFELKHPRLARSVVSIECEPYPVYISKGLVSHNCTINLPKLAYLSKDEDEFFELLEKYMEIAKNSLEIKRQVVSSNLERGMMPYTKKYLGTLDHHFSTIGLVGGNEMCLNLLGVSIEEESGRQFAIKVLDFMREKVKQFQEETGNLYNLEATPAEGCSYRLARIDKSMYRDIITAGTDKAPYYTNSTHLPANTSLSLYEAILHQEPLETRYTGGCVFHAFLAESPDVEALKLVIQRIFKNTRIPYLSITPTYSVCKNHGYIKGKHWKCPKCGEDCLVYSRVTGYYRPVQNYNAGKYQEFIERTEWVV